MPRSLIALTTAAALAIAVAGCGSGSSSTSSTTTGAAGSAQTTPSGTATTTTTPPGGSAPSAPAAGSKPSSGSGGSSSGSTSSGGDNSIQTYGSEASGADKAAVIAAMRSFMGALASHHYTKVCAGLTGANRAQLQQFLKFKHQKGQGCAALKTLLATQTTFARQAARATVIHVRVKGDTAFVIFRPGHGPVSYFVMKREHGAWKSISLGTGTPLSPPVVPAR